MLFCVNVLIIVKRVKVSMFMLCSFFVKNSIVQSLAFRFVKMADYWKSNAKKFCEICKVWFADNKISIENHERGLKHKVSKLLQCYNRHTIN